MVDVGRAQRLPARVIVRRRAPTMQTSTPSAWARLEKRTARLATPEQRFDENTHAQVRDTAKSFNTRAKAILRSEVSAAEPDQIVGGPGGPLCLKDFRRQLSMSRKR